MDILGSYVPFLFVPWGYFFIIMFLEAYKGKLFNKNFEHLFMWGEKDDLEGREFRDGWFSSGDGSLLVGFVDLCLDCLLMCQRSTPQTACAVREKFLKCKQNCFELPLKLIFHSIHSSNSENNFFSSSVCWAHCHLHVKQDVASADQQKYTRLRGWQPLVHMWLENDWGASDVMT